MREDEVLEILLEMVRTITNNEQDLTNETNLVETGVLDSLDFIDYIFRVQHRFGIEIPDKDLEKYKLGNLMNMMDYLMKRISK